MIGLITHLNLVKTCEPSKNFTDDAGWLAVRGGDIVHQVKTYHLSVTPPSPVALGFWELSKYRGNRG